MDKNEIEEKLDILRNSTAEEIKRYDVKNEWKEKFREHIEIETRVFFENEEFEDFNSYEKMLLYKRLAGNLDIDCDVSLRSIMIYAIAFDYVLDDNRKIQNQIHSKNKYCFTNGINFDYRGDTMNSFKQILDCYLNFLKSESKYTDESFINVRKFIELNHTVGNFIPVPFKSLTNKKYVSFNQMKNSKVGDYWDLTMYYIYNWYISENENYLIKLVGKSDDYLNVVKEWLKKFGSGMQGWKEFVDKNYLKGSFVNEKYEPEQFWNGHFNGKIKPEGIDLCKEFFSKVPEWIEIRGQKISEVIKNKLEKENTNNCQVIKEIF